MQFCLLVLFIYVFVVAVVVAVVVGFFFMLSYCFRGALLVFTGVAVADQRTCREAESHLSMRNCKTFYKQSHFE